MTEWDTVEALEAIRRGAPIRDAEIKEPLDLRSIADEDSIVAPVEFTNCRLYSLNAVMVHFHRPLVLENTEITTSNGSFSFCYFFEGLIIESCAFGGELDSQCGEHNGAAHPFLTDSTFHKFVNFFDCWFMGPVEVQSCRFEEGTNLLGNRGESYRLQFDVAPAVESNSGNLELSGG